MNKKTSTIILGAITMVLLTSGMNMAHAQDIPYLGNIGSEGQTGSYTLEEALKLSQGRVVKANENPELGSGTPYLDAGGVVGATLVSAGIFGGIAATFFAMGRKGKYAAMGRG